MDKISYSFCTAPYPMNVLLPASSMAVLVDGAVAAISETEGSE
jgi:hypothetical protein